MNKARIIATVNFKGGVAKSSTVASLGSILARKGFKVLVVDLDAQANLTTCLSASEEERPTIYDALTGKIDGLPIINISEGLALVPSSLNLAMVDVELSTAIAREHLLYDLLEKSWVKETYDFVLLDCPPSLGLMTLNAITACTDVIIPLVAEALPLKGMTTITNYVDMVRRKLNPNAHITGILITKWLNSNLTKNLESQLRETLGDLVYTTKIRHNVRIAEAPLQSRNIVDYAPESNGAKDYTAFAEEFLSRMQSPNINCYARSDSQPTLWNDQKSRDTIRITAT